MISTELYTKPLSTQLRQLHEAMSDNRATGRGNFDGWLEYGVGIEVYQETFSKVLGGINIVDFVKGRHHPVVVDLMSPSEGLADLFRQISEPGLGLAVSLEDLRRKETQRRDHRLNIYQLAGDVTKFSTWNAIDQKLKGKKADLIMERGKEGLVFIPVNKRFYAIIINKLWNMLSEEGGIMLIETPGFSKDYLENVMPIPKWIDYLKTKGIDAAYDLGDWNHSGTLRVTKKTQSPKVLPFL